MFKHLIVCEIYRYIYCKIAKVKRLIYKGIGPIVILFFRKSVILCDLQLSRSKETFKYPDAIFNLYAQILTFQDMHI